MSEINRNAKAKPQLQAETSPGGKVRRIGLTGGIGSGKSAVAARLASFGAAIMDADAISRSVTAAGGIGLPAILREFGPEMITPEGALHRDRMRAQVFNDPHAKQRLERIIHPLVGQETDRLARLAVADGHLCLVFDIPLLVESRQWRPRLDCVVVVDCEPDTQIQRVMARNGLPRDAILAILANQASRQQRLAAADAVIFNDGIDFATLDNLVAQLAKSFGL